MTTTGNEKLLPVRFSPEADKLLRKGPTRRGDLTKRVLAAIDGVDLSTVQVEERSKTPGSGSNYEATTIKFPEPVYDEIKKAATERKVSMSALIDGCVREHFAPRTRSPSKR